MNEFFQERMNVVVNSYVDYVTKITPKKVIVSDDQDNGLIAMATKAYEKELTSTEGK